MNQLVVWIIVKNIKFSWIKLKISFKGKNL